MLLFSMVFNDQTCYFLNIYNMSDSNDAVHYLLNLDRRLPLIMMAGSDLNLHHKAWQSNTRMQKIADNFA